TSVSGSRNTAPASRARDRREHLRIAIRYAKHFGRVWIMATVTFRHGDPRQIDYTPSGADVDAGEVVVVGNTPMVAHLPITDGELGALAVGGGVYRLTAAGAIDNGDPVYWEATDGEATATASGNLLFGIAVSASTTDQDPIDVYHAPDAAAAGA